MSIETTTSTDKEISSAEMTGIWRCDEPVSGDTLSQLLVSEAGVTKARTYQTEQYKFASRHFSLRSAFFISRAVSLVSSGEFDSMISIGSGFSLLTYCVALKTQENGITGLTLFDSDLAHMIEARRKRFDEHKTELPHVDATVLQQALDIEQAYKDAKESGKPFKDFFPAECERPVFILEGTVYFLSKECLDWIFEGIGSYDKAVVIFDYWPSDAPSKSKFFSKVLDYFSTSLPENVQSTLTPDDLARYQAAFSKCEDLSLAEAETESYPDTAEHQLTDIDTYIPARFACFSSGSGK